MDLKWLVGYFSVPLLRSSIKQYSSASKLLMYVNKICSLVRMKILFFELIIYFVSLLNLILWSSIKHLSDGKYFPCECKQDSEPSVKLSNFLVLQVTIYFLFLFYTLLSLSIQVYPSNGKSLFMNVNEIQSPVWKLSNLLVLWITIYLIFLFYTSL